MTKSKQSDSSALKAEAVKNIVGNNIG